MVSPSSATIRTWPVDDLTRVPAWIYSDPELYEREMEKFFYGEGWSFVGLECEVPTPGSYKRSWIGERQVILTRDLDGGIHVVENRCAHRGAPVCWKNRGEARGLVCPFHHWAYDLKGDLKSLPFMRGVKGKGGMPGDFDRSQHGLGKLRTFRRGGAVWASFVHDGPDFESYVGPEIMPLYDRLFSGRELKLLGYSRQHMKANWKVYIENVRDPYHATILHPFFVTFGLFRADVRFDSLAPQGGRHVITMSKYSAQTAGSDNEASRQMANIKQGFTLEDMSVVSPIDEFGDGMMAHFTVFPSLVVQQHANVFSLRQIIPRGVNEMELCWIQFGYADDDEAMAEARMKQGNLVGPAGYVSLEDGEIVCLVNDTLRSRPQADLVIEMGGKEIDLPNDSMLTEGLIRAFYQFYRQEMGIPAGAPVGQGSCG